MYIELHGIRWDQVEWDMREDGRTRDFMESHRLTWRASDDVRRLEKLSTVSEILTKSQFVNHRRQKAFETMN